jgi:outer membrane receptor protein involved in Fe transport
MLLTGAMVNYRFRGPGATSWRLQLNVNNIFNTQRLYLTRTFNDGSPRNFGRQPGREFIFSVDLEH